MCTTTSALSNPDRFVTTRLDGDFTSDTPKPNDVIHRSLHLSIQCSSSTLWLLLHGPYSVPCVSQGHYSNIARPWPTVVCKYSGIIWLQYIHMMCIVFYNTYVFIRSAVLNCRQNINSKFFRTSNEATTSDTKCLPQSRNGMQRTRTQGIVTTRGSTGRPIFFVDTKHWLAHNVCHSRDICALYLIEVTGYLSRPF